jgi:hypothetical protein
MPASSEMHLTMQWSRLNPIELEAGDKLKFGKIPAAPGVYRIQCQMGQKMRVYIGEAGNLKKRIDTYGRVYNISGGRVPPNRRLNRRLRNVLTHTGGEAYIQVATQAKVSVGVGRTKRLKMVKEFHRLLAEGASIVYELMYTDHIVLNAAAPDAVLS